MIDTKGFTDFLLILMVIKDTTNWRHIWINGI